MLNLKGKSLGRYHLIEPLGEGGMAVVYKAYDANLDRNVAIKVIRTEMGSDASFLQRFQREAKALAHLDHPYILKVLDYGEQEGIPYLVMPFVSGGTLKEKMGNPFSPTETARFLVPIARALAYAHQQGIIHRDVKPANILITPSGAPTLSDFGIAKILEHEGKTQLTATGVGMGTPDYMAPEQWLGTVDARTDVYALGVILYQMITGRLPYTADTPAAVLLKHMQDPLPRPRDFVPSVPESVERVIFKALAKDAADRFQDMGQFADAMEKMNLAAPQVADQTIAAAPRTAPGAAYPSPAQRPATPAQGTAAAPAPRRLPWLAIGGGIALLALACIAAAAVLAVMRFRSRGTPTPPVALVTQAHVLTAAPTEVVAAVEATAVDAVTMDATEPPTTEPVATATPAAIEPAPTGTKRAPLTKIAGLPEDIPVLIDNNGDLIKQESNEMDLFMYTTLVSSKDAAEFFHAEMLKLGWAITNTTTMEAQGAVMYSFEKSGRTAMINIAKADAQTMVQIMLQKNAP